MHRGVFAQNVFDKINIKNRKRFFTSADMRFFSLSAVLLLSYKNVRRNSFKSKRHSL